MPKLTTSGRNMNQMIKNLKVVAIERKRDHVMIVNEGKDHLDDMLSGKKLPIHDILMMHVEQHPEQNLM